MVHHASSVHGGKTEDMNVSMEEMNTHQKLIYDTKSVRCGKKSNFFLKELAKRGNVDWFLDAKEAKKIGMVDQIKIPFLYGVQQMTFG
jgi:ATP-dependent protease ClpP protease subunit